MSADWTTCRVVRVPGGGLWERMSDHRALDQWAMLGSLGATLTAEQLADSFPGEFTPVLDADGLPVVRTVGDLTARHVGKRVRVGLTTFEALGRILATRTLVSLRGMDTDGQWTFIEPVPLDTPCEVLP